MKNKDQIRITSQGTAVRRNAEEVSFGTFREVKEGQPIPEGAELIQASEADSDGWRDVTSIYSNVKSGPAQVATPKYRAGYDRIFGKKPSVGLA